MDTDTRAARIRREVKDYQARRLQDECVVWISANGERKSGVVSEVNSGIAKVNSQKFGVSFVRADLLRPFWGAWS
jgi:hypothetical protein